METEVCYQEYAQRSVCGSAKSVSGASRAWDAAFHQHRVPSARLQGKISMWNGFRSDFCTASLPDKARDKLTSGCSPELGAHGVCFSCLAACL